VEIPKYFLNQLSMFESRLSKLGIGPKTNTFNELSNENDLEEKVIHNTYLNGLNVKIENRSNIDIERKISNISSKRITWADNNNLNRKDLLCNTNFAKDLFYQKDIKPILNHKKGKPIKPILKKRSSSADPANKFKIYNLNNVSTSTNLNNSNINNQNAYSATSNYNSNLNNYGTNNSFINNENKTSQDNTEINTNNSSSIMNNYMSGKNYGSNNDPKRPLAQNNSYANINNNSNNALINTSGIGNKENSNFNSRLNNNNNNLDNSNLSNFSRPNYFNNNNNTQNYANNNSNNNPQQRSYSLDQKNDTNNRNPNPANSNYGSNNNQGELTKIIITPNIHSIYNHNINNYYIQSSNDLNFDKIRENTMTPPTNLGVTNLNFDPNVYKMNERPNSVSKKDANSAANSNNISPLNAQGNHFSYNNSLLRGQNQLNTNNLQGNMNIGNNNKLVKSLDNQRMLQNNYLNQNSFLE